MYTARWVRREQKETMAHCHFQASASSVSRFSLRSSLSSRRFAGCRDKTNGERRILRQIEFVCTFTALETPLIMVKEQLALRLDAPWCLRSRFVGNPTLRIMWGLARSDKHYIVSAASPYAQSHILRITIASFSFNTTTLSPRHSAHHP